MNVTPKSNFGRSDRPRNSREQALVEWHRLDLAPLEKARHFAARPAGEVLRQVLNGLQLDRRRSDVEVLNVWNQVLDPHITAHAQPVHLVKGTLFVNVDHSVWLSEIVRYRRKEILNRLQLSFGPKLIRKISFRLG